MLPVLVHPAGKLVTWCGRLTFKICDFFPPVGSSFCSQIDIIQLERKKKLECFQYKAQITTRKKQLTTPRSLEIKEELAVSLQWQIHHKNKAKRGELAASLMRGSIALIF